MNSINYSQQLDFSKLFIDFIEGVQYLKERFPSNATLFSSPASLKKRAETFVNRESLASVISNTMKDLTLTDLQIQNLEALRNSNSLAVVTGQQVGFLGGPVYTLLKIIGAIKLSKKLPKLNNYKAKIDFIPIFWIEDNDHDNLEASHISLLDNDNKIEYLYCSPTNSNIDRTCVANLKFNRKIERIIQQINTILPTSIYKNDIIEKLNNIYKPGKSWSLAFIELLNSWLGSYGILYISAYDALLQGLYIEQANKELQIIGKTDSIINSVNISLKDNGYHIQSKSSEINLFMHIDKKRFKIKPAEKEGRFIAGTMEYDYNELRDINRTQGLLSPNVLLRPVFQDSVIPTVAYIAGPSEIGYCAQIREIYDYFEVPMPAFVPRHSATFINNSIQRLLERKHIETDFFLRKYEEIEKEIIENTKDDELDGLIKHSKRHIELYYSEISKIASQFDSTLKISARAAGQKSLKQLDWLEKKINAAQKRRNFELFNKYNKASNYIYPANTLQERLLSPLCFMNVIGEEAFVELVFKITDNEPVQHYIENL